MNMWIYRSIILFLFLTSCGSSHSYLSNDRVEGDQGKITYEPGGLVANYPDWDCNILRRNLAINIHNEMNLSGQGNAWGLLNVHGKIYPEEQKILNREFIEYEKKQKKMKDDGIFTLDLGPAYEMSSIGVLCGLVEFHGFDILEESPSFRVEGKKITPVWVEGVLQLDRSNFYIYKETEFGRNFNKRLTPTFINSIEVLPNQANTDDYQLEVEYDLDLQLVGKFPECEVNLYCRQFDGRSISEKPKSIQHSSCEVKKDSLDATSFHLHLRKKFNSSQCPHGAFLAVTASARGIDAVVRVKEPLLRLLTIGE